MHKFNVGDRIRCVNAEWHCPLNITAGKIYTITTAYPNGNFYIVNDNGRQELYMYDRFELVKDDAVQTYTTAQQHLYDYMMQKGCYDLAMAWASGLKGEAPIGWEKKYKEFQQKDLEYQEYLRLKAKFEG